jgi:23S rRNA (guanosine2251-2'-O)-methyltransferase
MRGATIKRPRPTFYEMFATVLHNLKSPENAGLIVRTHVAFGGEALVLVGPDPWRFKKRYQAFSRRLERMAHLIHIPDDERFFQWCRDAAFTPVAIEISENPTYLPGFGFPDRPAVIVGNEGRGLPDDFTKRCASVVTIPQFGGVACLNAAVSCCIALYELNRNRPVERDITGHRFSVGVHEIPEGYEQLLPPKCRKPQS